MKNEIKKLTVGDMSGCNRAKERCTVVRESIAGIAELETVEIRFKDEFHTTPYRLYYLEKKFFRDEFDAKRGRYTGVFVRVPGEGK